MGYPVRRVAGGRHVVGPPEPVYITNLSELCTVFICSTGAVLNYWGTPYYVDGADGSDDNDGTSRDTAVKTLTKVETLVSPGDVVFVKSGTYLETGSLYGWQRAVDNVDFYAVGGAVTVTNPAAGVGGRACRITADNSDIYGFRFAVGTDAPNNCVAVEFYGAQQSHLIECVALYGNNATHSALVFDNNAAACGVWSRDTTRAAFFGPTGLNIGTTIKFLQAVRCYMNECGFGVSEYGAEFSGNAIQCSVDKKSLVQDTRVGFYVLSGATQNIYAADLQDVSIPIIDNSGNATNNPKASPLHTEVSLVNGAGTHNVTLFHVHGTVEIKEIYGNVTESPGNVTAVYLSVEDGVSTDLTKSVGAPALTGLPIGSLVIKDGLAAVILGVYSSVTPQVVEGTGPFPAVAFQIVEEQGGAGTTVDLVYTTTGTATGEIEFHIVWEPKSDGAYVSLT